MGNLERGEGFRVRRVLGRVVIDIFTCWPYFLRPAEDQLKRSPLVVVIGGVALTIKCVNECRTLRRQDKAEEPIIESRSLNLMILEWFRLLLLLYSVNSATINHVWWLAQRSQVLVVQ